MVSTRELEDSGQEVDSGQVQVQGVADGQVMVVGS